MIGENATFLLISYFQHAFPNSAFLIFHFMTFCALSRKKTAQYPEVYDI